MNGGKWSLVKEYTEVESGKRIDRLMLDEAIKACVDFVAADMPNANRLTVGIMAMVGLISAPSLQTYGRAALNH